MRRAISACVRATRPSATVKKYVSQSIHRVGQSPQALRIKLCQVPCNLHATISDPSTALSLNDPWTTSAMANYAARQQHCRR